MIAESSNDDAILADLKKQIEALSDGPVMWSRSAYTPRRTAHVIFANGAQVAEGEHAPTLISDKETLRHSQIMAILRYRDTIKGRVDLVWRVEPQFDNVDGRTVLYTRLCFEPSCVQVAPGVFIEERLTA